MVRHLTLSLQFEDMSAPGDMSRMCLGHFQLKQIARKHFVMQLSPHPPLAGAHLIQAKKHLFCF